jgi:hypothetical protein
MDATAVAINEQTLQQTLHHQEAMLTLRAQTAAHIAIAEKLGGQTTPSLPGTLTAIDVDLNQIAYHLSRIADNNKKITELLWNIELNGKAQVAAMNTANRLHGVMVATTKEKNDFDRALTEQALTLSGQPIPKLPPWPERIKQTIKDATEMVSITRLEGYATDLMKDTMQDISTYLQSTIIYRTISAKLDQFKQAVLSIETPSIASIKSKAANLLGLKSAVYYDA